MGTAKFNQVLDPCMVPRAFAHCNNVIGANQERRDVHLLTIYLDMPVADDLTGLLAGSPEPHTVDDVIKPSLEDLQQGFARHPATPASSLKISAELTLQHTVVPPKLLFLPQLQAVLRLLSATDTMLSRRSRPPSDWALVGIALGTLEIKLNALAPALPAGWADAPSHATDQTSPLDPPTLRWPASIMWDGRYVFDHADLESGRLKGAYRCLTAGTGTFNENLNLAYTELLGSAGSVFCCHLRGEGCAFSRALESN